MSSDLTQEIKEVLAWYADPEHYDSEMHCRHCSGQRWSADYSLVDRDSGAMARELLKVLDPQPKKCMACNGSGRYDSTGSPPCGACNGTGFEE